MRRYRDRRQLLAIFFMLGFVIGILYANIISKQYVITAGIFNEYFLNQYAQTELMIEDYIGYLLRVRLLPLVCICLLGCTKWKKLLVGSVFVWTGFSSGILAVSAVIKLGIKGILLCFAGIFPQALCYIAAYLVLLWYLYQYPNGTWNTGKTIFFVLVFASGFLLETYISPLLIKLVIRVF